MANALHSSLVSELQTGKWAYRCACGRYGERDDEKAAHTEIFKHLTYTDPDNANSYAIEHDLPDAKYDTIRAQGEKRYGCGPANKPYREAFGEGVIYERCNAREEIAQLNQRIRELEMQLNDSVENNYVC